MKDIIIYGIECGEGDNWQVVNDYQLTKNLSHTAIQLQQAIKSGKVPEMSNYPEKYRFVHGRICDDGKFLFTATPMVEFLGLSTDKKD